MSVRNTVVIRADGGSAIGMGHIMRCIGLAQELAARHVNVFFALASAEKPVVDRLGAEGIDYSVLGVNPASPADLDATRQFCTDNGASALVVDGYAYGGAWLEAIGKSVPCLMLWTDYLQSKRLPVDVLLDQTAFASAEIYRSACPDGILLCGLDYTVLRREFRENTSVRRRRSVVKNVLVTMGGADPVGATLKVMEAIPRFESSISTRVVVGSANPDLAKIRELASSLANCEVLESVHDMSLQLGWADLAISAAGTSLWEFAYAGLPALATSIADNQLKLAEAVEYFGGGVNLGEVQQLNPERISAHVDRLVRSPEKMASMSENMMQAVDGSGVERVATGMLEFIESVKAG